MSMIVSVKLTVRESFRAGAGGPADSARIVVGSIGLIGWSLLELFRAISALFG